MRFLVGASLRRPGLRLPGIPRGETSGGFHRRDFQRPTMLPLCSALLRPHHSASPPIPASSALIPLDEASRIATSGQTWFPGSRLPEEGPCRQILAAIASTCPRAKSSWAPCHSRHVLSVILPLQKMILLDHDHQASAQTNALRDKYQFSQIPSHPG